ncbi:hypothetical protein HGG72_22535 [Ochrobactrum pecoris]|uniref:Uncharacterized protein n=1 Tax=Brucella pecoris TaxID=867683 RepID=A0A5C5CKJ5_9HYPH|nr:hypothetical protein [Brucella pecoris]MBB4091682.1 hypothetical protein [Brucella pecoris]NKW82447.1 hypothetical protein [Brucella pecoris]TNV11768.1 hypothetical protein FIB18_13235 [Brucella pecoris]
MGWLRSAVMLCLAIAALYGMQHSTPYYSEILSPVSIKGQQGKPTETSRFAVGVANVHRTRQLTTPGIASTRTYNTDGEWLVIEAAAKAKLESLNLMSVEWLGPNGIRYAMSKRLTNASGMIGSERLEPGIPRPVLIVFELPPDQIAGGKLLISESSLTPLSEQAQISMISTAQDNVSRSIAIKRMGAIMPWQLEVSQ